METNPNDNRKGLMLLQYDPHSEMGTDEPIMEGKEHERDCSQDQAGDKWLKQKDIDSLHQST